MTVGRSRPATAALAALRQQSDLVKSGFDIKEATNNYVTWFFRRTIPASQLKVGSKMSAIGIDNNNLAILIHVFARHIIDHAEWNVDPDKLSNLSQAGFVKKMKAQTLGYCIDYLIDLVKGAQK